MVRISDARMSGTAFGTIILHVSPESAVGGPLALIKNGDRIRLSVRDKKIDILLDEEELNRRRKKWINRNTPNGQNRGYDYLYSKEVMQADEGCDFNFLLPKKNNQ